MRLLAFRVLAGVALAVAVGCFDVGVWMVTEDLGTSGEMFDGLLLVLGLALMGAAALAGALAAYAAVAVRHHPTACRVIGVLLGLTGLGVVYPLGVDTPWGWWLLPLPVAMLLVSAFLDGAPTAAGTKGTGHEDTR